MNQAVFQRESAVEYFKDLVDRALTHQGVATQELTSYYVVQLLAGFLQQPARISTTARYRCGWRRRSKAAACGSVRA